MDIKVKGGQVLTGDITPSGSKNSAVAIIPATILFDKPAVIHNVPDITDTNVLVRILHKLGSKIDWNKDEKTMEIDNSDIRFSNLGEEDLGNLKGTSLLWGPMLARFKKVDFSNLPGGCTLGLRPLDTHYLAFKDLGVKLKETQNGVVMNSEKAEGRTILLNEMSPTATENVVMLATGLKGETTIYGAASEPQVQDLCEYLISCGANIKGTGSNVLKIKGSITLSPKPHSLYSDHYEITTFLALAASTGGSIRIRKALPGKIENILQTFSNFGVEVSYEKDTLVLEKGQKINLHQYAKKKPLPIKARPWPGLPVDTMPLFIPMALSANEGQVLFHNWMYEAGLFWTSELLKLGANIFMGDPHRVLITAGNKLRGATLEAPYIIRAVVAMVMAAMIAEGESMILDADALYRGHPNFSENLRRLGAQIIELPEDR
ncbi:UDP-N-acetylglucosamine 1-carboxyvinyltransferase [Candidatus Woesebacteria bacterium]|nr:UDP-N-acetylglucosamine 1-carboxyvinyltransferase [Candidatus Woesebacteria bacterium]